MIKCVYSHFTFKPVNFNCRRQKQQQQKERKKQTTNQPTKNKKNVSKHESPVILYQSMTFIAQ